MKVSIITSVLNNRDTLDDCIKSVMNQSHGNIEHIIIDGGSSDGSLEVIKKYDGRIAKVVHEPDDGIYFALNRGLSFATGDIVGFLHADDFYAHNRVIERVVSRIGGRKVDSCYGDLVYVSRKNTGRIIRYWKSCPFEDGLFRKGWMPPHPTFFVKKEVYDTLQAFNTDFTIASDYELMIRFLGVNKITTSYIPEVLVKMRTGGASNRSLKNMVRKTVEDYRVWKVHKLRGSVCAIFLKNVTKIPHFFQLRVR